MFEKAGTHEDKVNRGIWRKNRGLLPVSNDMHFFAPDALYYIQMLNHSIAHLSQIRKVVFYLLFELKKARVSITSSRCEIKKGSR